MDFSNYFGLKYFLVSIGGFLLMIGASIEPSVGVWVVSVGGSLVTSALGKDRSFKEIMMHIIIGLCFGIFGSQIVHGVFSVLPQIASSFFLSLFGVEVMTYVLKSFEQGSITDFLIKLVVSIVPWKKKD